MNAPDSTIHFNFQHPISLGHRKRLKRFIANELKTGGKSGALLNFIFCTDDQLLTINQQYLNHDYYTDIITFDLSEKGSDLLISDIYISVDRVKENARLHNARLSIELHRVIFHGVLHLLGFKDKTVKDQRKMRAAEEVWLASYFIDLS